MDRSWRRVVADTWPQLFEKVHPRSGSLSQLIAGSNRLDWTHRREFGTPSVLAGDQEAFGDEWQAFEGPDGQSSVR